MTRREPLIVRLAFALSNWLESVAEAIDGWGQRRLPPEEAREITAAELQYRQEYIASFESMAVQLINRDIDAEIVKILTADTTDQLSKT